MGTSFKRTLLKRTGVLPFILCCSVVLQGTIQITEIPPGKKLACPKELRVVTSKKYGTIIGGILGAALSSAIAFGFWKYKILDEINPKYFDSAFGASVCAVFMPTLVGFLGGKTCNTPINRLLLARKHNCPITFVKASLKFCLPLSKDLPLMIAAYAGNKEKVQKILSDLIHAYFGDNGKKLVIQMIDDFGQVMNIARAPLTYRQQLKQLRDLEYLENYDARQRQLLSALLRRFLVVYDLYYKKHSVDIYTEKNSVYLDHHLGMTLARLAAIRQILNEFIGNA